MKRFSGFSNRTQYTPIPNVFFSQLLSQIDDIAELKVTLHIFWLLYPKRSYPRFVSYRELLGDRSLMNSFKGAENSPDDIMRQALEMAVGRGTILHLNLIADDDKVPEDVYFLNTESDRRAVARIQNGELALEGLKAGGRSYSGAEIGEQPDIFTLYEENIGIIGPMVAEELKEAEKLYPEAWIKDAFREAVSLNKRSWRYIARILERWSTEGRSNGTYRRDSEKTDPDKYIKGQYGHMVER